MSLEKSRLFDFVEKPTIKCVFVGDSGIGKSSVVSRLLKNSYKESYKPTVFDNFAATVVVDGTPYVLSMFDTAGKEDFGRLRTLSYMNCDVFIVCFSVAKRESFRHVMDCWLPEIKTFLPETCFILVGTQCDLRDSLYKDKLNSEKDRDSFISWKEGVDAAQRLGADSYIECSALSGDGLEQLKEDLVSAAHKSFETTGNKTTGKGCCSIV